MILVISLRSILLHLILGGLADRVTLLTIRLLNILAVGLRRSIVVVHVVVANTNVFVIVDVFLRRIRDP